MSFPTPISCCSAKTWVSGSRLAVTLIVFFVTTVAVCALPGDLDATFNLIGSRSVSFGAGGGFGRAIAVQSDNKIVAAGYTNNGVDLNIAIARFNVDGSLDTSFDTDGQVTTPIFGIDDGIAAIAIQPNGKIVAAGYAFDGVNYRFAVLRYNAEGSLDSAFGTGGITTTVILSNESYATSLSIQSNGKIVAGGAVYNGTNYDFSVVRYNVDGTLDSSFDTDGIVVTPVLASDDAANSLAIQTNGRIVAGGYARSGSNNRFALVRYNADGSLDTSFDGDGKATTTIFVLDEGVNSVALQPDGKIVAGGYTFDATKYQFAVLRFNADGSLDPDFDTDGKVTTSILAGDSIGYSVLVQSNQKIVLSGSAFRGMNYDVAFARYTPAGALDPVFSADGKAAFDIFGDDLAFGTAIDSFGRIAVVGESSSLMLAARIDGDLPVTAAAVTVSGRVTTADGQGIRNVKILLTGMDGSMRRSITGSFGYYSFDEIQVGETVTISISSKRYQFSPPTQVLTVNDAVEGIDFSADRMLFRLQDPESQIP